MKYRIRRNKSYRKSYKLCENRGYNMELLDNIVYQLANGNRLDAKHNDHKLHGKYTDYRECHIEPDWLLI
ncbi:MAG: type II toxin-antitoxin system YafQ family toxin, partial [Bacteroidetes bacterium]|nr:type II toxin-antitoxin system YafQ family toxin [Bacteroidota bacterium]